MDFLFNNPLANMPGGWFLFFYGTTILVIAIAFWLYKSSLDWTSKLALPIVPSNPDPFEIAYLRGGDNEFARAVIFSLVQKGFLQITNVEKKSYIALANIQPNWTTLSETERSVLGWFQVTRETSEVFSSFGITDILKPFSLNYEQKIIQNNFLTPADVQTKTRILAVLVGLAVALLGSYKIVAALFHGRTNVIFALIMIVISFIIFYNLGKVKRLSNLGQQYVERIQQAFENLKTRVQTAASPQATQISNYSGIDPFLLAVGVFGVGALAGTAFNDYEQAFHRAGASGGSSCGSGCGSSSCSSGGDGGGDSGGGGCGGCGGGGD